MQTLTQANQDTVQELFQLVEDSLSQAKQAYTELAEEREAKVRLEKVANENRRIDSSLVDRTVKLLVRNNYLEEDQQEKFAAELASHPENALKLVNRLVEISAPVYSEGRGIPKQASAEYTDEFTEDNSGWLRVVNEGA